MAKPGDALLERAADQIEASEERCVAAAESGLRADLYIAASREAIRRSLDQLARLARLRR